MPSSAGSHHPNLSWTRQANPLDNVGSNFFLGPGKNYLPIFGNYSVLRWPVPVGIFPRGGRPPLRPDFGGFHVAARAADVSESLSTLLEERVGNCSPDRGEKKGTNFGFN